MTSLVRRVVIVAVGLLGGLFAWPLIEVCVNLQSVFPSYFAFTLAAGVVAGAAIGAFFASAEGLMAASPRTALGGALGGAAVGAVGGVAGAFAAQALLFAAGEGLTQAAGDRAALGLALARAAGWAVVGAAVGTGEGLRARSLKKACLGAAGGAAGGFAGGLALAWAMAVRPDLAAGRLLGLLAMAGLTAGAYALLEKRFALGALKVLNGPLKGKEFLINQRLIGLGAAEGAAVCLKGYRDVGPDHALLRAKSGGLSVEPRGGKVLVNEAAVEGRRELKLDDVVQVGGAKLLYGYFG